DESAWNTWISIRDAQIRARLAQGDQDAIVNWLLGGTTFTAQPRMDIGELIGAAAAAPATAQRNTAIINSRIDDFVNALGMPETDGRTGVAPQCFQGEC